MMVWENGDGRLRYGFQSNSKPKDARLQELIHITHLKSMDLDM